MGGACFAALRVQVALGSNHFWTQQTRTCTLPGMKIKTRDNHHKQSVIAALETASSFLARAAVSLKESDIKKGRKWIEIAQSLIDTPPDEINLRIEPRPDGLENLPKD